MNPALLRKILMWVAPLAIGYFMKKYEKKSSQKTTVKNNIHPQTIKIPFQIETELIFYKSKEFTSRNSFNKFSNTFSTGSIS